MLTPMSNQVLLLRHAQALQAYSGQADIDRGLSPSGLTQCERLKQHFLQHTDLAPQVVLCSTARRTRETLLHALPQWLSRCRFETSIYAATPATLLQWLLRYYGQRLLLVGHNPGLEQLLTLLLVHPSAAPMRPASLCHLRLQRAEPGGALQISSWTF